MAQSTTTLLQAANEVLIDLGERPILNFGGNLGIKIKSAMTSATRDIGLLEDWSWLIHRRNADAWDGHTAILTNRRRLFKVEYQTAPLQAYQKVQYVDRDTFDRAPILSYSVSGGYPLKYTTGPELTVELNPYPTTDDEKIKIWFSAVDAIVPPSTVGSLFPVPERFVELIKKRALYYMAIRHLDDASAASMYNNEFEVLAQRFRDTERQHTVGQMSMYRRRYRR